VSRCQMPHFACRQDFYLLLPRHLLPNPSNTTTTIQPSNLFTKSKANMPSQAEIDELLARSQAARFLNANAHKALIYAAGTSKPLLVEELAVDTFGKQLAGVQAVCLLLSISLLLLHLLTHATTGARGAEEREEVRGGHGPEAHRWQTFDGVRYQEGWRRIFRTMWSAGVCACYRWPAGLEMNCTAYTPNTTFCSATLL
jgi:hypothetical protein